MAARALALVLRRTGRRGCCADEIGLAVAGDLAGAGVGEEELALAVDDHDAVGGALEEVGVALQRLQAPLGLEAGEGDLLRLIAQRLQDARVAQRDGRGVGDGAAERQLVLPEGARLWRARRKSTPIGLSSKRIGRSASELKPAGGSSLRTTSSSGCVRASRMTSGSPADITCESRGTWSRSMGRSRSCSSSLAATT